MPLSVRRLARPPRPVEQWQHNLWVVLAAGGLFHGGQDLFNPFLPLFVLELGVSSYAEAALWSGLMFAVTPLLNAFVGPWWGSQADRHGRRAVALVCLTLYIIVASLMIFVRQPAELLLARAALGALGGFTNLALVMATHGCPRERVGQVVGSLQSVQFVALAAVPPLGGLVVDRLSVRANLTVSVSCFVLCLLLLMFAYRPVSASPAAAAEVPRQPRPASSPSWWALVLLPGVFATMLIQFVVQFVDRGLFTVVPLFVTSLLADAGGAGATTGLITGLAALGVALSASLYGRLAARHSPDLLLTIALGIGLVLVLPMALVQTVEALTVLRVLLAVAAGGLATLAYTRAARVVPASRSATGFSLLTSSAMLGGAVSPLLVGLLASLDLRVVFVVDALLYALASAVLLRSRRGRDARP
jgi:MFS family permease